MEVKTHLISFPLRMNGRYISLTSPVKMFLKTFGCRF